MAKKYIYGPGADGNWLTEDTATQDASAVGIDNPYLFTGRRWDASTGLYYYRFRDYAPQLGRFCQTDPAGYIDTMNLYAYCANNPVNWIDPFGLVKWGQLFKGVSKIAGGLAATIGSTAAAIVLSPTGVGAGVAAIGMIGGLYATASGITDVVGALVEKDTSQVPSTIGGVAALPGGPKAVAVADAVYGVATADTSTTLNTVAAAVGLAGGICE